MESPLLFLYNVFAHILKQPAEDFISGFLAKSNSRTGIGYEAGIEMEATTGRRLNGVAADDIDQVIVITVK